MIVAAMAEDECLDGDHRCPAAPFDVLARANVERKRRRARITVSPQAIVDILSECVRRAGLRASYVEMLVTRGQPPWGSRDPRQALNQFYAFAVPYVWIANEEQRRRGMHVAD